VHHAEQEQNQPNKTVVATANDWAENYRDLYRIAFLR
jgi:hypothetical protein